MVDRQNFDWLIGAVAQLETNAESQLSDQLIRETAADHDQFLAAPGREPATILLGGHDEDHLEANFILLRDKAHCGVRIGPPIVRYHETIAKTASVVHRHGDPTGASGQFAHLRLLIEPLDTGTGLEIVTDADGATIPKSYATALRRAIQKELQHGLLAGYPMIDLRVSLSGLPHKEAGASVLAAEIAAREAVREAINKAAPFVVEPVMRLEVIAPEDSLGDILVDLQSRRGSILLMEQQNDARMIAALVPLANLFGYSNTIRAQTRGRGSHSIRFDHYERIPPGFDDDPTTPEPAASALRA